MLASSSLLSPSGFLLCLLAVVWLVGRLLVSYNEGCGCAACCGAGVVCLLVLLWLSSVVLSVLVRWCWRSGWGLSS